MASTRGLLEIAASFTPVPVGVKPVPPGTLTTPVSVDARQLQALIVAALSATASQVIWYDHDGDVLVHVDRTVVALFEGVVLVGLTLETEQTGAGQVAVPLSVGSPQFAAGLLVMTESRPRGPVALVDRWGDAAVAASWRALIDAAHALALHTGIDASGARLVPGALSTDGKTFTVVPQARHAIDAVVGR